MDRLKEIEERIEILKEQLEQKDNVWDFNKSYPEYVEFRKPQSTEISKLRSELRMIMPVELSELPTYGDVMPLSEFIECVKNGGFIDYDGFGRYVKDGKETNIDIYPSDVKAKKIRTEFDTIIWFNR